MPCNDGPRDREDHGLALRNDCLARLLCGACQYLESIGRMESQPAELKVWWKSHKELDAARAKLQKVIDEQNAIKKRTLAKLTREERNALGFV